jgi:hypothetical protein
MVAKQTTISPAAKPEANPMPTLTPEALKSLLAEVAELRAAKAAKTAPSGKSSQSAKNDWLAITAFRKKGFGTVRPREDVRSYSLWV